MVTSVPVIPLRREGSDVAKPRPSAAYMRGGASPVFTGWSPALRDASDEVKLAWRAAAGRAFDMIQNSGWIAGSVDQAVANTVGGGLSLVPTPDAQRLGMTADEVTVWTRRAKERFELWANNPYECDIEGKKSFGQMQATAFRTWFPTGEIVADLPWKRRPGASYGSKIRLIQPHRLAQKTREVERLYQGVRTDADGLPISYVFTRKEKGRDVEVEVRARDSAARPKVVHVFDGLVGQMRGISPLTPALQVARQFDQMADATLTAHLIRAVFAATIVSDEPTEEVLRGLLTQQELARAHSEGVTPFEVWQTANEGWYKGTNIDLGIKGRFAHLFPGQKLEFHSATDKASDYKDMALFLLREILRCLGLTYESGTGDYTNATYSSVRMATGEIFEITLYRRKNIVAPFCQAAYSNWLEEEVAKGDMPFPGGYDAFLANRAAACAAEWRGKPKPQADDLKTAKAQQIYHELGVLSLTQISDDLGVDYGVTAEDLARERDLRESLGLPHPVPRGAGAQAAADEDSAEEEPSGG